MKKAGILLLALCLITGLCACGGPSEEVIQATPNVSVEETEPAPEPTAEPTPEPVEKTSVTLEELAEGSYTGTMSGGEYANSTETVFSTILPADITVTIEKGQVTLYCEAVTNAYGILEGKETPRSPDGSVILSGSLPLQQNGDAVVAEGEVPVFGKKVVLNHNNMEFAGWELAERDGTGTHSCTLRIAMEEGLPVATITAGNEVSSRTATLPLALVSGTVG